MKTLCRAACVAAALIFTACAPDENASTGVVLNRGNGGEPSTLDPQAMTAQWEINIASDMFLGLFTSDARGNAIPGAAQGWIVSSDGLTWTFHLRDMQWSDGIPVTANDFVFAWRRMVDPKSAMDYASLLYPFGNARAIIEGRLHPAALAAVAVDTRTLTLTLEHPAPYLPELLAHSAAMPIPKHVVEKAGRSWTKPQYSVSNGPYMLKEWIPNDHITLVKNPHFYDLSAIKIDMVVFHPTTNGIAALNHMRAGALDTQYPLPSAMIAWIKANMPGALRATPSLAVYYIDINSRRGPLADRRVREALSLSFDRESYVDKVRKLGEPPAYTFVPPGVSHFPMGAGLPFKAMPFPQRLERAQSLMRQMGYGPEKPLRLTYLTSGNTDPVRLAAMIQNMWSKAYFDIEISQAESQIVTQRRRRGDFELAYASWGADYDDAENFLGQLFSSTSSMNSSGYSNLRFDALLAQASNETDSTKRGEILRGAEDTFLMDYAVVPYRFSVTPDLVAPYVKGWIANAKNHNSTRWLWLEK